MRASGGRKRALRTVGQTMRLMARDEAHREAEMMIEEVLRSGETALNLSSGFSRLRLETLTELPESLGQLTHLRSLIIAGSSLTSLPEWLCQLRQLQKLDLEENELTALPESLCQLTHLRWLDLAHKH